MIIPCPLPELTIEVKKQANGDCGLLAIAVAFDLCASNDPTTILWQKREQLIRPGPLDEQKLTSFPKNRKSISIASRKHSKCTVYIYVDYPREHLPEWQNVLHAWTGTMQSA